MRTNGWAAAGFALFLVAAIALWRSGRGGRLLGGLMLLIAAYWLFAQPVGQEISGWTLDEIGAFERWVRR